MNNRRFFIRIILCVLLTAFALSACTQTESPPTSNPTPAPTPTPAATPAPEPADADPSTAGAATVDWLSPMLAVSLSKSEATHFTGELPAEISTSDFGGEHRGKIVTAIPEAGQAVDLAQLTAEELMAAGAVKLTANFAYAGDREYRVRFRFRVDEFVGHSITEYGIGAGDGVMILWQDANGVWWNIRRTGLGGQYTGGELTPGYFNADGSVYNCYTFVINKDTASNFASQDFYVIILEDEDHHHDHDDHDHDHDHGHSHDHSHDHGHDHEEEEACGFVITYQAEMPDHDGHFHNFAVLSSTTTYITVSHEE